MGGGSAAARRACIRRAEQADPCRGHQRKRETAENEQWNRDRVGGARAELFRDPVEDAAATAATAAADRAPPVRPATGGRHRRVRLDVTVVAADHRLQRAIQILAQRPVDDLILRDLFQRLAVAVHRIGLVDAAVDVPVVDRGRLEQLLIGAPGPAARRRVRRRLPGVRPEG